MHYFGVGLLNYLIMDSRKPLSGLIVTGDGGNGDRRMPRFAAAQATEKQAEHCVLGFIYLLARDFCRSFSAILENNRNLANLPTPALA